MNFNYLVMDSILNMVIFLSTVILLVGKITKQTALLGMAVSVALATLLWLLSPLLPSNIGIVITQLPLLVVLYKISKDLLLSLYCWFLGILIINSVQLPFLLLAVNIYPIPFLLQKILSLFVILLCILTAWLLRSLFAKFPYFIQNRKFMFRFSSISIGLSIIMLFVNSFETDPDQLGFYIIVIFLVIAILLIIIDAFRQLKLYYKKQADEDKERYLSEVEAQQSVIRDFRHDYINLLLTMKQYLQEDDLASLKQYFYEEILPTSEMLKNQDVELGNLGKLRCAEIKSLLSVKIMKAQSLGIRTIVEIPNIIEKINMKTATLARILGVFLDNAIEECEKCEAAKISVAILTKPNCQLIIVKNTCCRNMPSVKQIFEKGFSTKGDGRGLGLSNVRKLLDKLHHVSLTTLNRDGYFIQELMIGLED